MNKFIATFIALVPLVATAERLDFEHRGERVSIKITNNHMIQDLRFVPMLSSQAVGVMERGDRDWLAEACSTYVPEMGKEYEDSDSQERRAELLAKVLDRENFTKPVSIKLLPVPVVDEGFLGALRTQLAQQGLSEMASKLALISQVEVLKVNVEYGRKSLVKIFRENNFKKAFSKLVIGKKISWPDIQKFKIDAHGLDFLCDLRNGNIRLEFSLEVMEAPRHYRKHWLTPVQVKWLIENLNLKQAMVRESDMPVRRGRRLAQLVDQNLALKNTPNLLSRVQQNQAALFGGDVSHSNIRAMSEVFVDKKTLESKYKGVSVLSEVTFE